MIIVIYFLLYVYFFLLAYNKFRRKINVLSVFNTIWYGFAALSSIGLLGLRTPENKVHILVCCFTSIVNIIMLLFGKTQIIVNYNSSIIKRAKFIQFAGCLLILPLLVKVISTLILSGNMTTIRNMYFSGNNFSSMYMDLLFRLLPIGLLTSLIMIYCYISVSLRKYKFMWYALANAAFITFINGGRYALMMLIYSIVVLWCVFNGSNLNFTSFIKYKKQIKGIIIALIIIMLALTINRGQEIWRSIVVYFSGSLSFLDYILANPIQFDLDEKLYGYLTFGAVIEPLVLFFKGVGLTSAKVPSYFFNICCQKYYNIAESPQYILFNANTSVLYYFIRDFGYMGVIVGSAFLGGLWVHMLKKWKKGSVFGALMFIYLSNVMFNSIMTFQLFGPTPLFVIAAFWFCTRRTFIIRK